MSQLKDEIAEDFAVDALADWGEAFVYADDPAVSATTTSFNGVFIDGGGEMDRRTATGIQERKRASVQFLAAEVTGYESDGYLAPAGISPRGSVTRSSDGTVWRIDGAPVNHHGVVLLQLARSAYKKVGRG